MPCSKAGAAGSLRAAVTWRRVVMSGGWDGRGSRMPSVQQSGGKGLGPAPLQPMQQGAAGRSRALNPPCSGRPSRVSQPGLHGTHSSAAAVEVGGGAGGARGATLRSSRPWIPAAAQSAAGIDACVGKGRPGAWAQKRSSSSGAASSPSTAAAGQPLPLLCHTAQHATGTFQCR